MSATRAKKPGRPLKDIKEREVFNLAQCGCTDPEIAAMLDCGKTTIQRRFGAAIKRGRDSMRGSLRAAQYRVAVEDGHPTMLIWLGKQLLGQKNEPRADHEDLVAPPSMIEMAAAMDCSIPLRPGNSDENGAAKRRL